jgi:hypothetical protein
MRGSKFRDAVVVTAMSACTRLRRRFCYGFAPLAIIVSSCHQDQTGLDGLVDAIEQRAQVVSTGESESVEAVVGESGQVWHVLFVPASGFDERAAREAGLPDSIVTELRTGDPRWKGDKYVVYARPGRWVVRSLCDDCIDLQRQLIVRGSEPQRVVASLSRVSGLPSILDLKTAQ